jgi:hypothetical protein
VCGVTGGILGLPNERGGGVGGIMDEGLKGDFMHLGYQLDVLDLNIGCLLMLGGLLSQNVSELAVPVKSVLPDHIGAQCCLLSCSQALEQ